MKIKNEKESQQRQHGLQNDNKYLSGQENPGTVGQRDQQGRGGDGNAPEGAAAAIFLLLPPGLQHVEIGQPDGAADTVNAQDDPPRNAGYAQMKAQQGGKNAKAYGITQGIQLNTKGFFLLGTAGLAAGHRAVEGIAYAGENQTKHSGSEAATGGKGHAADGRDQAHEGEDYGVIVDTKKFHWGFIPSVDWADTPG